MVKKHMVIPDTQTKPGTPLSHFTWAGEYATEKRPDVIIHIGDFADMPSLSSYDIGKKTYEGRTYKADIESVIEAQELLFKPIRKEMKKTGWKPRFVLCLGNHENRINRAVELDRKLEGTISVDDLQFEKFGWKVVPYLQPINIDGIMYCHYFTTGVMGRPVTSARALVTKKHMSCTMGHTPVTELDMSQVKGDGTPIIGLFAGAYYQHDEDYLGPQGNPVHRQLWMKHEVNNGFYYPCPVSINFLKNRYE